MHDAEQFRCEPSPGPGPEDPETEEAAMAEHLASDDDGAAPDPDWIAGAAALVGGIDAGLALVAGNGWIRWCNQSFEAHHPGGPWTGRHVLDLHDPDDPVYEDPGALRLASDPDAVYRFEREVAGQMVRYCLRRAATEAMTFVLETSAMAASSAGPRPGPFPEALVAADGSVRAANGAFAGLIGERVGSLLGRSLAELVDATDRPRLMALLSDTVEAGTTTPGADAIEVRLLRVDGEAGWAELALMAGPHPTGTAGGVHDAPVLVQARDITARKRDALLLQEVFEAAPLPYALVDTDGVVVGVNPAWRQRLGPHHGPGRRLTEAVAGESRQQLADLLRGGGPGDAANMTGEAGAPTGTVTGTRSTAAGFELVTLLELADGGPALARLRATALHDLDERVERLLVSLDDLTAHALEVEAARRVSGQIRARLDELDLAVVSHDAEGRAHELNLGAVRLFGEDAASLIGTGPLPPGWQARHRDQTLLASGDQPLSRVLAAGGPLTAADIVWLAREPSSAGSTGDAGDLPATGTPYLVRARAVTQLRPARRVGAVVAYVEIEEEPFSTLTGEDEQAQDDAQDTPGEEPAAKEPADHGTPRCEDPLDH